MMESDVAKPLRMLSAYLMTAAMTRPPSAWRNNKHAATDGHSRLWGGIGPLIAWTAKLRSVLKSELHLQNHHGPGDGVVALEHPRLPHPRSIVGQHPKDPKDQTKHTWEHTGAQEIDAGGGD